MNRKQLLDSLQPGGKEVILTPGSSALGHLGAWLKDATDRQNQIVVKEVKVDQQAPEDSLVFRGKASLLGVETEVKGVFQLANGTLARYHLIAALPGDWRLQQSFPLLPGYRGTTSFFEAFKFKRPLLVIAAKENAVTDAAHGLKEEPFDNGLNLYSAGLEAALPVHKYGVESLPGFGQSLKATPVSVKGRLLVKARHPEIQLLCWYTADDTAKLGAATVLNMGLGFRSAIGKSASEPGVSWLWELQVHPDEAPFVVVADLPRDPKDKQPPTFKAIFDSARHLTQGINALGPVAGGQDLSAAQQPFSGSPSFSLATLSFSPGRFMGASLILLDSATAEPYEWQAVEDLVTVEKAVLSFQAFQKPKPMLRVGVSGIANLDGYLFEVEVTPGERVSGALESPHEIDVEAMVSGLFGHDLDLPNLQLKLLRAEFAYEMQAKTARYALAVGGNIDLLGNGALVLKDVGFEVESTGGKATYRKLTGGLAVARNPLRVTGEYQADTGWEFEGRANPYKPIPLNHLAEDVVHAWGASLPPGLPEVTLYQFGLRFGVRRKLFRAWARTRWQPPEDLPWYTGEIDALVDVSSRTHPTTARRETELELEWTYTTQDPDATFRATAAFGSQERSFFISWDGGKTETLGLGSLHKALHLQAVFDLPDGANWKVFDFRRLVLGYTSVPRLVQFLATSRLGDGDLTLGANLRTGSRNVEAVWTGDTKTQTIGVDTLLQAVDLPIDFQLPGSIGKDIFEFDRLTLRYEADPDLSLQFLGHSDEKFYKDLFLVVTRGTGGWGFVAGAAFKDKTTLADIPGIGDLPGLDEVLKNLSIEPVFLLVSTIEKAAFLPPIFQPGLGAAFGTIPYQKHFVTPGTIAAKSPFGRASLKLAKGASVAAKVRLEDSSNVVFENVHKLTGLKELDGRVTAGPDGLEVMGMIPGQLKIPTGIGDDFVLSNGFLEVDCSKTSVTTVKVGGGSHFNLFGDARQIDLMLIVGEEAADASIHLKNVRLPSPKALPGVRFKDECRLEIGAQFEPEGLDLGFMAEFYIGDDPKKYTGKAVIVLEMIEEIPNPLYIQFSIEQLDLWAWFEAQTGVMSRLDLAQDAVHAADKTAVAKKTKAAVAGGLSEEAIESLKTAYKNLQPIFQKVDFRDVAMHWCDSMVILPDGTTALPGVGFRGWMDVFGFHTFAAFDFSISMPPTLTGHFEMPPVHLQGVLGITGDGKGVRVRLREARGQKGWDYWKDAGHRKESLKRRPAAGGGVYIVPPGGPVFVVSSQHSPFLHADIHFTLFELLHTDLTADVDEQGLAFKLSTGAGKISNLTLACRLAVQGGFRFDASGSFDLHLEGDVGPIIPHLDFTEIHLDCGLDGEMDIHVTEDDFRLTVNGTFEFEGAELDLPELVIDVPFDSLDDLPGEIWDTIEDNAEDLFSDFIHGIGDLAKKAVKAVGEVAEKAYHEVEEIGEAAVEEAKEVEKKAEEAVEKAGEEIGKAAVEVEKKAEEIGREAEEEVKKIGHEAEEEAKKLFEGGKAALGAAEKTAEKIGKAVAKEVSKIGHQIADVTNAAAHEVAKIAGKAARAVQHLLDDAGKVADAALKGAAKIAGGIAKTAKKVWKKAEEVWDDVKDLARKAKELAEKLDPSGW